MIKNKEVAIVVNELMQKLQKDLNESIILVQNNCDEDEFKLYRRAVATVMSDILLDIMRPIYREHPDIKLNTQMTIDNILMRIGIYNLSKNVE